MSIITAHELTPEVREEIKRLMYYHPWSEDQISRGNTIREGLRLALELIIECVPPSPDRSAAIRKLREARMDCNSAITHEGKY